MDWLLQRQDTIEQKIASRLLAEIALALQYDLSSSWFEGSNCPLARRSCSRDGRSVTLRVDDGLLTDVRGCPVAVSVVEGHPDDSLTFLPAVQRVRECFRLTQAVMVGDRSMLSQESSTNSAVRAASTGSPRSRACPSAAWSSKGTRSSACSTNATSPRSPRRSRRQDAISAEAALHGLYVIHTSLDAQRMEAFQQARNHKALADMERAFHSLIETTRIFLCSEIARAWLGHDRVDHFAATREREWCQWQDAVKDWELKRYFEII